MGSFEGRRALVTGGASGIGFASARRLRTEGANVAIVDLDAEAGSRAAAELGAVSIQADVSEAKQVARAFDQARTELGGLDLVHLNAGIATGVTDIGELSDEAYRKIVGVNVDGVVFGVREAVRRMPDGGAVVATASLAGLIAYSPDPVYGLTKHAVVGLVRALASQLEGRRITINAVCPGIVETPLVGEEAARALREAGFPLIAPEEVAEAVVRAAASGGSGDAWICQPGREPLPYEFRGVPGPRVQGAEGMVPPGMRP